MSYLDDLFALTGKTALVTGGATGIGRMCAEALARAGARVLIASRKAEACEAAAAEIRAKFAGANVEGFAGDIGSEAGITALAAAVRSRTDKLHILVNNSGRTWGVPLAEFPYGAWEQVMSVNVAGTFTLTRDLLPLLEASSSPDDPARVVNLGSVMGTAPLGDGAYSYAASKAAVHHLTRILGKELAQRHVTVNALAPGPFLTKMTAFALKDPGLRAKSEANIPLHRLGQPEDVAGAILYLCGRGGSYITGAVLPLDGGKAIQTGPDLFHTE